MDAGLDARASVLWDEGDNVKRTDTPEARDFISTYCKNRLIMGQSERLLRPGWHYPFFPQPSDEKIVKGIATKEIDFVQNGDHFSRTEDELYGGAYWAVWQENGYCKWHIGSYYTLFDYHDDRGWIVITGIQIKQLRYLTTQDAKDLGYSSLKAFNEFFVARYGEWPENQEMWLIDFNFVSVPEAIKA